MAKAHFFACQNNIFLSRNPEVLNVKASLAAANNFWREKFLFVIFFFWKWFVFMPPRRVEERNPTLLKKRPLNPIGIARIPNLKWKKAIYFWGKASGGNDSFRIGARQAYKGYGFGPDGQCLLFPMPERPIGLPKEPRGCSWQKAR